MLLVVLVSSILIGVITALLNANGIDEMMTKTLGPATQMAADAVEWRMNNYWTALPPLLIFFRSLTRLPRHWYLSGMISLSVTAFFTLVKWMPADFLPPAITTPMNIISNNARKPCSPISPIL